MPFLSGRRIRLAFAVFALVVAGCVSANVAASAATPDSETVTGPADGAVISGTAVVFSAPSADAGAGYQLRWSLEATVDAETGRLVGIVGGGDTIVTTTDYALVNLDEQTYFWQVRSLDGGAGAWSAPRSFTVDPDGVGLQLETYPFTAPTPTGSAAPASGIGGGVWVASASAFAVLFLVVVFVGARQARRAD